MGMVFAIAGRFSTDLAAQVARELMAGVTGPGYENWGMAYCYGNRLETMRTHRDSAGELATGSLAEAKTDMALLCFNEPGAVQPLVRRERNQAWAFACEGRVPEPEKLTTGEGIADPHNPEERLFLHLVDKFDPDDPVGSVESRVSQGLGELRFFLMNADVLVTAAGVSGEGTGSELWLGRAQLIRVISPVQIESVPGIEWERIPDRTVLALTRLRRTLP
jgi:hypothetical protein